MLTSLAEAGIERDERPPYRPFRVRVAGVRAVAPHFRRVTFTGPDLGFFGRDRLDQRIKLFFPLPGVGISDFGVDDAESHLANEWYARWLALPDAVRNPLRTFTVRAVRPDAGEIDVDFALHPAHEGAGPAATWIATAGPGDELVIVGPDVRSVHSAGGIDWRPGTATRLLLAGDETAVPAVNGILASLDGRHAVTAIIEVGDAASAAALDASPHADVHWVVRDPDDRGTRLHAAVGEWLAGHPEVVTAAAAPSPQELEDVDVDVELLWDSPAAATGEFYAWLAGEAAVIKRLRRLLVTGCGIDRKRVAFMGYWRLGRAEG